MSDHKITLVIHYDHFDPYNQGDYNAFLDEISPMITEQVRQKVIDNWELNKQKNIELAYKIMYDDEYHKEICSGKRKPN